MIKLAHNTIEKKDYEVLIKFLQKNSYLNQSIITKKFEKVFSKKIGSKYSVFVNSGSSANLLIAQTLLEGSFLKNKIVGVFNICGDQYLSRYNLIKKMFKTLKIKDVIINKCTLSKFNKKISFPKKLNLSNNKIKNKIDIKFTKFEKVLKRINV